MTLLLHGVSFDDNTLTMDFLVFANEWNTFEFLEVKVHMLILRNHDLTLGNLLDFGLAMNLPIINVMFVSVNYSKLFD